MDAMKSVIPKSLTDEEDKAAEAEGWALFEAHGCGYRGEIQIQMIDDMGLFENDFAAHKHVKALAEKGSELHLKVKQILEAHSKTEFDLVFGESE